ncbi:GGDEF domain-containing protein [Furfurilactobacillus curtus]|uniref:GGDEF domain-containing protein n=1 Tax=Furfurilactobacillus curtus TaxID=1746200 RepID=A0ABQ5JPI5_9LACO
MTAKLWLVPSMFTGVFFVLGLVLTFQLIINLVVTLEQQHDWSLRIGQTLQLHLLGVIYFSAFGIYFEYLSQQINNQFAFINFRILLLFYVVMFLGTRASTFIVASAVVGHAMFDTLNMDSVDYMIAVIACFILASWLTMFIERRHWGVVAWTLSLNLFNIALWLSLYIFWPKVALVLTKSDLVFNIIAFVILSLGLSIAITRISSDQMRLNLLRYRATTDPITELKNVQTFTHDYRHVFLNNRRNEMPLSLLAIDVDHFKQLNDQYGHLVGNRLLKELGELFEATCAEFTTVSAYRVGGEEFEVIISQLSQAQVRKLAAEIRQVILQHEFVLESGSTIDITISMGIAHLESKDLSPDDLYGRADQMLYRSKGQGRNQISEAVAD